MMNLLVYLILAVLIIAFAVLLTRQSSAEKHAFADRTKECGTAILDDSGLDLAERIFDPGDYLWLKDEIGFPQLASELARQRKGLALKWLTCLRSSFNELVRAPPSSELPGGDLHDSAGWVATFNTLRFQLLLAYAMAVVWLFGPYTRIAPTFSLLGAILSSEPRKERHGLRV
jgi:hypothetical protein